MNNLTWWKWRNKLNDLEFIFLNKIHSTFSAEAKGAEYTLCLLEDTAALKHWIIICFIQWIVWQEMNP